MNIELSKSESQTLSISKNKIIVALCVGIFIMIAMNMCLVASLHHNRGYQSYGNERYARGNMMYGNQFNNQYPPMMQGYKNLNSQVPQGAATINSGATSATKVAPDTTVKPQ